MLAIYAYQGVRSLTCVPEQFRPRQQRTEGICHEPRRIQLGHRQLASACPLSPRAPRTPCVPRQAPGRAPLALTRVEPAHPRATHGDSGGAFKPSHAMPPCARTPARYGISKKRRRPSAGAANHTLTRKDKEHGEAERSASELGVHLGSPDQGAGDHHLVHAVHLPPPRADARRPLGPGRHRRLGHPHAGGDHSGGRRGVLRLRQIAVRAQLTKDDLASAARTSRSRYSGSPQLWQTLSSSS